MRVRELVIAKKDWAEKERQKGLDLIDKFEQQIEDVRKQLIKLDGCLLALEDLESDINEMDEAAKLQREVEAKEAEELANKKIVEANTKKETKVKKTRKRVTKKK